MSCAKEIFLHAILRMRAIVSAVQDYKVHITTSYACNSCFSIILLSKPIPEDGIE